MLNRFLLCPFSTLAHLFFGYLACMLKFFFYSMLFSFLGHVFFAISHFFCDTCIICRLLDRSSTSLHKAKSFFKNILIIITFILVVSCIKLVLAINHLFELLSVLFCSIWCKSSISIAIHQVMALEVDSSHAISSKLHV